MKTQVLWTPQARVDLLDIYVAIGLDNQTAAERMYAALEQRARQLAQTPRRACAVRKLRLPREY
jgi:toxin ParE1/3/4